MVQGALAAAYAMDGQMDLARATLDVTLSLKPSFAEDPRQPYRIRNMTPELIEKLMEGLRKAGLDEDRPPTD
jgi:hypothetical protein